MGAARILMDCLMTMIVAASTTISMITSMNINTTNMSTISMHIIRIISMNIRANANINMTKPCLKPN